MVAIRRALAATAAAALAALPLTSALQVKSIKASVIAGDSIAEPSYTLKPTNAWPETIAIPEHAHLKVSFSVADDAGSAVAPAQAQVELRDTKTGETGVFQVGTKANGKAAFTINTSKLTPFAAGSSGSLKATLYLSSPSEKPVKWVLGDLTLPSSALTTPARLRHSLPPRAGEPAFAVQEEIFHTFQPEPKDISRPKAAIGTGVVLGAWLVLFYLIEKVTPGLNWTTISSMMHAFLAGLMILEVLIVKYWIGMRLYQLLPPFLLVSAGTAYIGTVALRGARVERLKAGGTP